MKSSLLCIYFLNIFEWSTCSSIFLISFFWFLFFLSLFIYFEREGAMNACANGGRGRERRKERIPSRLCTVSMGLKLTNCEITTWAKIKCWMLNRLNHAGAPDFFFFYIFWVQWRSQKLYIFHLSPLSYICMYRSLSLSLDICISNNIFHSALAISLWYLLMNIS